MILNHKDLALWKKSRILQNWEIQENLWYSQLFYIQLFKQWKYLLGTIENLWESWDYTHSSRDAIYDQYQHQEPQLTAKSFWRKKISILRDAKLHDKEDRQDPREVPSTDPRTLVLTATWSHFSQWQHPLASFIWGGGSIHSDVSVSFVTYITCLESTFLIITIQNPYKMGEYTSTNVLPSIAWLWNSIDWKMSEEGGGKVTGANIGTTLGAMPVT